MKAKRVLLSWLLLILLLTGCASEFQAEQSPIAEKGTGKQIAGNLLPGAQGNKTNADSSAMEVHFIDVGQADCILIKSNQEYMLVDAGNNEDAELITSYLESQGVIRLTYVIGTHPHEDHIGSLDTVIDTFEIGTVIMPPVSHTTKTFEDVLDSLENKGLGITMPNPGDTYTLGNASFVILAPNGEYSDFNNWSVGIKLVNGSTSFVMCGDAESEAEIDITNNGIDLSADVLKAGHHGSHTSTSLAFLEAVNPKYAVISCETGNSYGHPSRQTLERLWERGISIYRTDEQGSVVAVSDGQDITWSTVPSTSRKSGDSQESPMEAEDTISASLETEVNQEPPASLQDDGEEISVHITSTGEKYHRSGCESLEKSDISISLSDAIKKGYTPCKKCNPPE